MLMVCNKLIIKNNCWEEKVVIALVAVDNNTSNIIIIEILYNYKVFFIVSDYFISYSQQNHNI